MGPLQRLREDYAAAVATILQTAAVPYGVTLTVWGSGALVMHFRGRPKVFEVFLFALGGIAGYTLATLPTALVGAQWVRVANNSKTVPSLHMDQMLRLFSAVRPRMSTNF